ncbi:hypothetical protein GALMADRAFT_1037218 [Galerina marginata CBS 339.88]|uniref:Enoyl reductase (ER) domain-containing protein n=1 Tax=Galerina marginata (strain CBS 339.88) TaxID=685588 RepID=A0A067SCE3_GALM3|nr:hypothetical protein GALMADRAFT_1037218 [Galerina marginata CBS 339.88]
MPSTQKALFLEKQAGDLVISETAVHKPGPGDVLIKIQATSLNPVDWKIWKAPKYAGFLKDFPAILGTAVAGDIEEVGEEVEEFKKGDRVFCQGQFKNDRASFQQYTLSAAAFVARIPPGFSYDQISTLPVALSAAYVGMYNVNPHGLGIAPPVSEATQGQYSGNPILVFGGASTVGQLVLQFAKLSGFSPIITTASLKHADVLKPLGATNILDRNLPADSLIAEVNKLTEGKPIKLIFDTVASESTQQVGVDILSSGGKMVLVGAATVKVPEDKMVNYIVGVASLPHNTELLKTLYHDKISELLEKGIIKTNTVEVLPNGLAGIPDGLARMEANKVSASKLVAHPQDN